MTPTDETISRKHILVEDDRTGTSLETLRRVIDQIRSAASHSCLFHTSSSIKGILIK